MEALKKLTKGINEGDVVFSGKEYTFHCKRIY